MLRFENVIVDARDHRALADFWRAALGWVVTYDDGEEICLNPGGGDVDDPSTWPFPDLAFEPVEDPDAARQRVHLDLASASVEEQQATVERLLAAGATWADVGQPADAPFTVLADPEGNAFCVLDPRDEYCDTGSLAAVVVAAQDANALRDFYVLATGWDLVRDEPGYVAFRRPDGRGPFLELITREGLDPLDARKNRIHLDFSPREDEDQAAYVDRLLALGATRVDVGQGPDVTWVVLADPEGNELCVLRPRP